MKVCVYTICKNEINNLDKWLECMKYADYMVVLDTGSTDGTFEKLKSYQIKYANLKVYQRTFDFFRFDDARNAARVLIPEDTDICVSMDLDETFNTKEWCNYLKSKWNSEYKIGSLIYIDNKENGIYQKQCAMPRTKIHTRKDGFWKFPVHEIIVTTEKDTVCWESLNEEEHFRTWLIDFREPNWDSLIVFHNSHKSSTPLYVKLSEIRLKEYPGIFSTFIRAQELFRNQKYDDCYVFINKALKQEYEEIKPILDFGKTLILFYKGYIELYIQHDKEKAISTFKESLSFGIINESSCYELVKLYDELGNIKERNILIHTALNNIFDTRFLRYSKKYNDYENYLYDEFNKYLR